jgi:hypothetical protein
MSNVVLPRSEPTTPPVASGSKLVTGVVLVVWFTLVIELGAGGAFVTPPGTPPLPILIAVTAPVVVFLAGYWMSSAFREFVLAADLRLMMGIQAWRFAGLGFLALYAHGVLSGIFAWPAGLGDIAIAVTAPWILVALIRQPSFAGSKTFMVWNVLGILDLVMAVGIGARVATGVTGEVTTSPMGRLPLVLAPAYLVPIWTMLHLAALFQAQRVKRLRY